MVALYRLNPSSVIESVFAPLLRTDAHDKQKAAALGAVLVLFNEGSVAPWTPGPLALLSTISKPMRQLFLVRFDDISTRGWLVDPKPAGHLDSPSYSSISSTVFPSTPHPNSLIARASRLFHDSSFTHHPPHLDCRSTFPCSWRVQTTAECSLKPARCK